MQNLSLINWNDKRASEVKIKIESIEKSVTKLNDVFKADIQKVQVDNSVTIPFSFEPGDYKV